MSEARRILTEVIDASYPGERKKVAAMLSVDIPTLSKMLGGTRPFGVDDLELLDRDTIQRFWKRYGQEVIGLRVQDMDVLERAEKVVRLFDELNAAYAFEKGERERIQTKQLKAEFSTGRERKVG